MVLRVSKFMFLTLLIYFIGIANAKPKGDEDGEKPSEPDKNSPDERPPEETIEDATERAIEEKLNEMAKELATELAPVVSEMMEAEKEMLEELFTTEKPLETEEESPATAKTEEEPQNEVPEEKTETTPAPVVNTRETTIEKEEAPKDAFAVLSTKGKICILAKFHATFSIMYTSQRGEEKAEVTIPKTANSKGMCGSNGKLPLLQLYWAKYAFKMMFNKTDEENWAVTSVELTYDTAEPLFDGAVNDLCCLQNFSFDKT